MLDLLRELPAKADRSLFKVERWCTPDEGLILYALCQAHEIRTYLECGTANGYSALWAAAAEVQHIHTWDVHDRQKIWLHKNGDGLSSSWIKCHVGPFHEGVGNVYATGPRLFFIDGDHERDSVRRDWRAVRRLIEPGDVMVFHDATCVENILELCKNLRTVHGYRGGIINTARGMGVYFA